MLEIARNPKQIGAAIRAARRSKGWSQEELAARAGLRQKQISMIETGYASAKLQMLLAVLASLGLELRVADRSADRWSVPG